MGVTPSNITGIIDRLLDQGFVNRSENPENRREILIWVTEKGKALLAKLRQNRVDRMNNILAQLNNDDLTKVITGYQTLFNAIKNQQADNQNS